jgi:hypothetical protein
MRPKDDVVRFACKDGKITAELTLIRGATQQWIDIDDGDFGEAYFDVADLGALIDALTKLRDAALTPAPSEPQQ